jgi:putative transposase
MRLGTIDEMSVKQPHRKRVKHFHEPGDLHELTFSCYRRLPLLTNDDWRCRLSRCLDQAIQEAAMQLVAFVYMPEHVHLLVYPTGEANVSRLLGRLKQPFSKEIKQVLVEHRSPLLGKLTVRERPGKTCFRFWQEGPGFDRNLFTPDAIAASIAYIHHNPVARGLCQKAIDWNWSSARYFLCEPPRQQYPDLPFIHGLPVGALDKVGT